jgi:hypothetical protein
MENSVDPFILQKLETKAKRIADARKDRTSDTEEIGELDFESLKLDLITDPVRKAEAERDVVMSKIEVAIKQITIEKAGLSYKIDKVKKIEAEIESEKEYIKYFQKTYGADDSSFAAERIADTNKNIVALEHKLKRAKKQLENINVAEVELQISQKDKILELLQKDKEKQSAISNKRISQAEKIKKESPKIIKNDFTPHLNQIEAENKTFGKLDYTKWRQEQDNKRQNEIKIKKDFMNSIRANNIPSEKQENQQIKKKVLFQSM